MSVFIIWTCAMRRNLYSAYRMSRVPESSYNIISPFCDTVGLLPVNELFSADRASSLQEVSLMKSPYVKSTWHCNSNCRLHMGQILHWKSQFGLDPHPYIGDLILEWRGVSNRSSCATDHMLFLLQTPYLQ